MVFMISDLLSIIQVIILFSVFFSLSLVFERNSYLEHCKIVNVSIFVYRVLIQIFFPKIWISFLVLLKKKTKKYLQNKLAG